MNAIGRALRVHGGEGRTAGLMVALTCTTSAGLTIGESAVTALFLGRLGPDALPAMYLGQGLAGLVAMLVLTGWLARVDRRRAYVAMPLLLAGFVLVERAIVAAEPGWIYPVLWLTVSLDWLLSAVFLWGTAGLITDTRSAKRLFPLFAAGGILGAVLGGLLTKVLAGSIGTSNLLLVWTASLLAGAVLCAVVIGLRRGAGKRPRSGFHRRREPVWADIAHGLAYVRRSPLLVWMTVAGVLFSVLFYSLYLPFAQAATDRFPDQAELAGFLGLLWAAITAVAFLTSVFLANRVLGWLGAAVVILVLPVVYAGSFGLLLATSTLASLVTVRFAVSVWLQGVTSPAWETLVNVVPESRRDQVRAFLNGGPAQVGTAIAGLVAMVGERLFTPGQLTITGLVVAVATIIAAWRIRRSYAGALVDALRAGRPRVFERTAVEGFPGVLAPDAKALDVALEASADPDPRLRRLAVAMLSEDPAIEGSIREVLTRLATDDEDGMVRALAVRAVGRAHPDSPVLERALVDEEPVVRLAAIESLPEAAPAERVRGLIGDLDPAIAAATSVASLHGPAREEALDRLRGLLADPDPEVRGETLRRLGRAGADAADLIVALLRDDAPSVRTRALRSLAAADPVAAVAPALEALSAPDPAMREAAFDVLAAGATDDLAGELSQLASREGSLAVADGRLARSVPNGGPARLLLRDALLDRARSRALVSLSAVALLSADRDVLRTAVQNLRASEPGQLANALETLETSEHRSLVRPLLGLWEQGEQRTTDHDGWLAAAAGDPDPMIRACADLVRATDDRGDPMATTRASMSPMERVLVLRTVPLFAELTPAELRSVADIAEERVFADGEVLAVEGDPGDELHIVLEGTVEVIRGSAGTSSTLARRGPGEVVGEMSIISRAPRMASLVAGGEVRTLRIGHREFESMLRERPDVSFAVMRVLADRLRVETVRRDDDRGERR